MQLAGVKPSFDVPGQRAVLFDTETTGLDPLTGDRIIEIAALELIRDLPTGVVFHRLVDPDRDIDADATRVHGLTRADLQGKPRFAEIVEELLDFIGGDRLVAHNATFDFSFLNAELARLGAAVDLPYPQGGHAGDRADAVSGAAEQP